MQATTLAANQVSVERTVAMIASETKFDVGHKMADMIGPAMMGKLMGGGNAGKGAEEIRAFERKKPLGKLQRGVEAGFHRACRVSTR